ncbi:bile acid:sodium symporter family protein [Nonomuraea sp. MG754425]|uniref:bile acid:sodium symporter family protein n=1 Tax=Nonomuraea sp. MG754425 TaxID=2570319 RepID=UPI001F3D2077|nr:bile acid:sodium symporter [Nonomuraea sp. MG754425]
MNAAMLSVVAVLMLGLGLGLTVADFRRVRRYRWTVAAALGCQLLVLPLVCFAIVRLLGLPPAPAAGMMLVAAAPGGPLAGVYAKLFGGDVAFNLTLTAVNSVLSVFTLTAITNLSLAYFLPDRQGVGLHGVEIVQVFAAVLVPIAAGMAVKARWGRFAERAERVFRVLSGLALAGLVAAGFAGNLAPLVENLTTVFPAVVLFALASLTAGYGAGRLTRAGRGPSIAAGMEVGFHNAALALTLALSLGSDLALAVPAGIYGLTIMIVAAGFGLLLHRVLAPRADDDATADETADEIADTTADTTDDVTDGGAAPPVANRLHRPPGAPS